MPQFNYKGRAGSGEMVAGVLEGADFGSIAAQLQNMGVVPVDITPAVLLPDQNSWTAAWRSRQQKIPPTELMLFSRQMNALLKAGVPIMRALGSLEESSANPTFKSSIRGVREGLDSGRDLSTSMSKQHTVFSPFYVAMVYVGETTGRMEDIFARLFKHLEFQDFMRSQVKAAVRYPIFVVAAMAIAITIINLFVIPAFAKAYKGFGAELPFLTQMLIGFSDLTVRYWPLLALMIVGGVIGFKLWVRTPPGRLSWDAFKLRIPIAGKIMMKATIARFCRSFALAIRSGVPIVNGLSLTAQTLDNVYIANHVEKMRASVERGDSVLRTAVRSGVFTPVALQMIMVGEESGALDDMLEETADMYQREVEYELKTLSAQIEPILIVGLGVLVLILALGVFLPIWDLGKAALHKG